jgi:SAM-dependent methyltransferase
MTTDDAPRLEDHARLDDLARLYDLDLDEDPGDLDLYLALAARAGGPVLELACGSGRLTVPMAAAGHDVTGVDFDPAMLARARAREDEERPTGRLTWVDADLVGLRLPGAGEFGLAFIALNSLMALPDRDSQREALRTLAAHVRPGGLIAVDVWQPDIDDLARFDGRLILEWLRADPGTGEQVTKTGSAQHDAPTQTVTLTQLFESGRPGEPPRRWIRTDRLRLISADELAGMAGDVGLEVEVLAGGYDLAPLGPGSDRAVLIAVRR